MCAYPVPAVWVHQFTRGHTFIDEGSDLCRTLPPIVVRLPFLLFLGWKSNLTVHRRRLTGSLLPCLYTALHWRGMRKYHCCMRGHMGRACRHHLLHWRWDHWYIVWHMQCNRFRRRYIITTFHKGIEEMFLLLTQCGFRKSLSFDNLQFRQF